MVRRQANPAAVRNKLPDQPITKALLNGKALYRIHSIQHGADYFNTGLRFGNTGGCMYTAENVLGAVVEVFGRELKAKRKYLARDDLTNRYLSKVELTKDIALVEFSGKSLLRNNVDSSVFSGSHRSAQKVSEEVLAHRNNFAGIWYPCKHNQKEFSAALFQGRCEYQLRNLGLLSDRQDIMGYLDDYQVTIIS